ncbi:MAG: glycosyltransferase [Kiritimatiellia bacterium]|jgi:poly(glycerol-phosphate) alpha-glucosyltransferase|nr:glycosyltransferase [Kiritimatiellia bacterium]MDP6810536.1 glycosyltransferase [Kiritimatiellia bacterium]
MHCAVLTSSISRLAGGLFVSTRKLSMNLLARGIEIDVLGVRDTYSDEDLSAWQNIGMHLFDTRRPHSFAYAPGYAAKLDTLAPDLVHCHGLWQYPSVVCTRWARRHRRPYLVSPRGMLDPWALANSRLKKQIAAACFQRRHLQHAACLHALCESEAASMRAYGLTNPICVVPNGIDMPDTETEHPAPWPTETVGGRHVILFLGRLHPKKGLADLLQGWAALLHDRPGTRQSWCLVIGGWDQGGHRAELERQAAELGISDGVWFAGPLHGIEKAGAFQHATAFILPSYSEGMPIAVLEAWSYGLPVGITPQCNIPEGVSTGAAIEMSATATGVRQGLEDITTMPDMARADMGQKGQRLVRERFTWEVVTTQMLAVYEWLCKGASRPDCVQLV